MTWFEALILGVIQGATEFLPISSSGHLVLGQTFLGIKEPQLLFDIVLHVGTLVAVCAFYWRDLMAIVVDTIEGLRRWSKERTWEALLQGDGTRLALLVGLATIPTGIIGVFLEKLIEPDAGAPLITATVVFGILIVNGFILFTNRWLTDRERTREGLLSVWNVTLWTALIIGVAQGLAVTPGISRSGTTITIALALGVARTEAARFSFLLSIPAILGALVLKFDPTVFSGERGGDQVALFLGGALVAAIVGYFCLRWLVALLKAARFHHFAWYCWAVGAAGLLYVALT